MKSHTGSEYVLKENRILFTLVTMGTANTDIILGNDRRHWILEAFIYYVYYESLGGINIDI